MGEAHCGKATEDAPEADEGVGDDGEPGKAKAEGGVGE